MSDSGSSTEHHIETFKATARGSGWPTAVAITDTEWSFQVDEPTEDGGSNSGPNPMHHLVASLAGCQNEQAQVVAEELGFEAKQIEMTIEVDLNLDGFMGAADNSDGCFKRTSIKTVVRGVNAGQATELGKRVDARCPILSVLRSGGAKIETNWTAG